MYGDSVIAEEVLDKVKKALLNGENWMAYNNSLYAIDKNEVQFFGDKASATEFANNNISDYDNYTIMYVSSIADLLQKIQPQVDIEDLEKEMQRFDWKHTFYDPLEANTEAETMDDHEAFNRLEHLIKNLQHVYENSAYGKQLVERLTQKYWAGHPIQEQDLLNQKTNVMNEENVKYLKDNIKYMGFGEKLNESLEDNMKQGKEAFQLDFKAVVNGKPFEATLHLRKSDNSDMYFFNRYDASLQKSNGEKVDQTFYLTKSKGITAKEAYNLLDGRAVHKELANKENVPYKAWVQLDFDNKDKHNNFEVKQFHENYGYDLKAAVSKYAIADLKDPEKEKNLMQSLQKGNLQSATIEKGGDTLKMFIEANPQYKSVTLYDGQMKRVQKENLEQYKSVGQSQGGEVKDQKKDVKANVKVGEEEGSKKKSSRKRGMSV